MIFIKLGLPMIDFIHDFLSLSVRIGGFDVVVNPGYDMIFETAFYQLVQDVWGHQNMNICTWKVGRKWLNKGYSRLQIPVYEGKY